MDAEMILAAGVGCLLIAGGASFAAELPPGGAVLASDSLSVMKLSGTGGEMERVAVTGRPFKHSFRARTKVRPGQSYGIQLTGRTVAPVKKGDVLLARLWVRGVESSDETGEALTEFVFEKSGPPWTKSKTYLIRAGAEWTRYDIPFVAAESYAAGEAHVCLRLGYDPQVIEIAALEVTNFAGAVKLADLPVTVPTYPGQAADALWRKAAAERIEKHRKADILVKVTSAKGRSLRGATVSVKMRRHAYGFGTAVNCRYLEQEPEGPDKKRYRQEILRLFNRAVLENNLKWPRWESSRPLAEKTVKWLRSSGLDVRGHCLVWPSWKHTPRDVRGLAGDEAALAKRVLDHVSEEASAMKGQLLDWDVINEPFSNHDIMDALGPGCMVDWFKAARQADPDVKLYINDYAILAGGGGNSAHRDHYEKTIRFLIDNGAPLDGIGVQCHFGSAITPPADLLKLLDRFARFGKPIQVTEFDMKTGIEALDGTYTRDFMTAMFSHPSTVGILMWGFWDGRHWKGNAPLYRKDWSLKPSGKAWTDLVLKEWWTEIEGRADRRGEFRGRGFLGDYQVTATYRRSSKTVECSLGAGGESVTIVLE